VILADLLRARADEDPAAVALRVGDTVALTYGEWEARSNAAARALRGIGVVAGDRVGLLFPNERWADYAVAYLGVLKAGAVAVPIGSRFSGPELEQVLAHAGARLRLTDLPRDASTETVQIPVGPDDLAEILYTSGTTGLPKGVAVTHAGIMAHDVPPDAPSGHLSFLHAFPIGTQAGQETLRVPLRIAGRTAIALPVFDPDLLCELVERHRVARLQLVPAMAQVLVASGAYQAHDVSSVRRIVLSSAPAAPALFERLLQAFPQATVWNAYALTEAGPARTMMQWDPARPTAVGLPVGDTEIHIEEATGEIWLRRRGTPARSYYNDPMATAEAFAGGWVHTGDVGYLDDDGYLHLTDRLKDLIITGGSNVSSVEVENALYEHPAVVDAAVVGVPHPVLGEDVAAAVVVRSSTPARELQDVVRARLAEHKVPHRIVLVDRLPRNASGKVVKADVRAMLSAPASAGGAGAPTEAEAVVVSIWEAVLGRTGIGVDDDFFAAGGHSLAAAQIAARLRDAFGVEVPVAAVFEHPTPAELAAAVLAALAVL
jgi:acyl-CoA synthetase (AMP-forming)/AMP-acid ligase II/acyl carrier protein